MVKLVVDLIEHSVLVVLAGDLLYLYQVGAWYDPNRFIELAEIIILWGVICFGVVRFILRVELAWRK